MGLPPNKLFKLPKKSPGLASKKILGTWHHATFETWFASTKYRTSQTMYKERDQCKSKKRSFNFDRKLKSTTVKNKILVFLEHAKKNRKCKM